MISVVTEHLFCYVIRRNDYVIHRNGSMDNPFIYGEIVPDDAFADRETELDRLATDLGGGQGFPHFASPIRQVLARLSRPEHAGAAGGSYREPDGQQLQLAVAFLEGYAKALATVETKWQRARTWLTDVITSARPELRYETDGHFSVGFPAVRTAREVNRLANEIFDLPGRLAADRKRTVVVALDEFQAIDGFNGGDVEHALRAAAQQQRNVGYVFAGSEPSLMEKMIGPRRPFYKAGPVIRLEKIPPTVFADFIERRFVLGGIRVEPGLGAAVVDLAGNLPYDVQRLAHETWDDVRAASGRKARP